MGKVTVNPFDNGKPLAKGIPLDAFEASPQLRVMTSYSEAPAAVYAVVLANISTRIRPGILTPVGEQPNLCVALRGELLSNERSVRRNADERLQPGLPHAWLGTWSHAVDTLDYSMGRGVLFQLERDELHRLMIGRGAPQRDKFLAMWDSETITRHRGKPFEAGTYRCVVCAEINPGGVDGYLFTPYAVEHGITTRFLFAFTERYSTDIDELYTPEWEERIALRREVRVELPDFSTVPDGPLPCPPAAKDDYERFFADSTSAFDKQLIGLRFKVATLHAFLHGRAEITDADWAWTEYPMDLSRSICCFEFGLALREWRWDEGKPPVRHSITSAMKSRTANTKKDISRS